MKLISITFIFWSLSLPSFGATFSFLATGDIPYSDGQMHEYRRLVSGYEKLLYGDMDISNKSQIRTLNTIPASKAPFVVYLGDIGRPLTGVFFNSCSQHWRNYTLSLWQKIGKPVFYAPGDNDWVDCVKVRGLPLDPNDVQIRLKNHFFNRPDVPAINDRKKFIATGESNLSQSGITENQMWEIDKNGRKLLFISLHVVGSENGKGVELVKSSDVDFRMNLNKALLQKAVNLIDIANSDYDGLVVISHVDPFVPKQNETEINPRVRCSNKPNYSSFCNSIEEIAGNIEQPVLFLHGDSNAHCLDKPFNNSYTNLWRLNAAGDYGVIDADLITFDPSNTINPFSSEGVLSSASIPTTCDYTYTSEVTYKYSYDSAFQSIEFSSSDAKLQPKLELSCGTINCNYLRKGVFTLSKNKTYNVKICTSSAKSSGDDELYLNGNLVVTNSGEPDEPFNGLNYCRNYIYVPKV